jgi:hypothetical protein
MGYKKQKQIFREKLTKKNIFLNIYLFVGSFVSVAF